MAHAFKTPRFAVAFLLLSGCAGQPPCPCMDPSGATGGPGKPAELAGCDGKAVPAQDGLVEDFEDENTQIVKLDGRDGYWWKNADKEGAAFTAPAAGDPFEFVEGANGSAKGLHVAGKTVKGSDQAYGVEVGTNLISTKGSLYDGSRYLGVSFWAKVGPKSAKTVRFSLADVNTHPELGTCKNCWNHFNKNVELSTEWAEYQVSFKEMAQRAGWGEPRPKSITPNQLYTLTFAFEGSGQEFELFVDDIQFVECKK
jgi:endoglucanase